MASKDMIEKQAFLLGARPGTFEDLILCPRCGGSGLEGANRLGDDPSCKLCRGVRVVERRVTVVVEDSPVGQGWPDFRPVQDNE